MSAFLSKIYHFHWITKFILNLAVIYPFLVIDQLLNTLSGGSPRETISGRLNRHRDGKGKWLVDTLDWLDKGHCEFWEARNATNEETFNPWR
jgi:hypothetical protein